MCCSWIGAEGDWIGGKEHQGISLSGCDVNSQMIKGCFTSSLWDIVEITNARDNSLTSKIGPLCSLGGRSISMTGKNSSRLVPSYHGCLPCIPSMSSGIGDPFHKVATKCNIEQSQVSRWMTRVTLEPSMDAVYFKDLFLFETSTIIAPSMNSEIS